MSASRRTALRVDGVTVEESSRALQPLARYLSSDHPLASWAQRKFNTSATESDKATRIQILEGETARELAAMGAAYYAQSRAFADFLLKHSNTEQVFGAIAQAIASGMHFEDWLQRHGAAFDLPTSLESLSTNWQAWLPGYIARGG